MRKLTYKDVLMVSAGTITYLLLCRWLIGFKGDQLFLVSVFNLFYYINASTRKLLFGFCIFAVFWIVFDSMKLFPNYNFNAVHVKDIYEREKNWFGIQDASIVLTPNQYALKHSTTFLDLLAGFFYLNWMPAPLIFAFYLFFKDRMQFLQFGLSFLFVNFIGFTVYYLYPAAPPWYVEQYGFDLHLNTPGNTAGLSKFDDYFGITFFHELYAKSSNVFAAMPSLHCAYPMVALYYSLKNRMYIISTYFFMVTTGIWFAAVYTNHHYVQDVVGGLSCAVIGLFIFQKVLLKTEWFNKFITAYKNLISKDKLPSQSA